MRMTTMKTLVDTLDENYKSPIATEIAEYWGCDEGTVREQRISANAVFRFKKSGETYFLRFNVPSERTYEFINAEIDFLHYVSDKNIRIAKPVKSVSGKYIETVKTKLDTCFAVVFKALQGKLYDIKELDASKFRVWGKALGKLHRTAVGYKTEHRGSWDDHCQMMTATIPQEDTYARRELDFISNWAKGLPVDEQNYGLIHYDFELDNIIWNGNDVSILDFDDCAYYWYVLDIAIALRDLFEDEIDFNNQSFRSFMDGYSTEMNVDNRLLKDLPLFRRMNELSIYARLLRSFEGSSPNGDDEWTRLWTKIEFYIDKYRKRFKEYHPLSHST
jgi:Ser/Thr protein kinase RdoA (MazF antagonist)